jgi:hypothetical protein
MIGSQVRPGSSLIVGVFVIRSYWPRDDLKLSDVSSVLYVLEVTVIIECVKSESVNTIYAHDSGSCKESTSQMRS